MKTNSRSTSGSRFPGGHTPPTSNPEIPMKSSRNKKCGGGILYKCGGKAKKKKARKAQYGARVVRDVPYRDPAAYAQAQVAYEDSLRMHEGGIRVARDMSNALGPGYYETVAEPVERYPYMKIPQYDSGIMGPSVHEPYERQRYLDALEYSRDSFLRQDSIYGKVPHRNDYGAMAEATGDIAELVAYPKIRPTAMLGYAEIPALPVYKYPETKPRLVGPQSIEYVAPRYTNSVY